MLPFLNIGTRIKWHFLFESAPTDTAAHYLRPPREPPPPPREEPPPMLPRDELPPTLPRDIERDDELPDDERSIFVERDVLRVLLARL